MILYLTVSKESGNNVHMIENNLNINSNNSKVSFSKYFFDLGYYVVVAFLVFLVPGMIIFETSSKYKSLETYVASFTGDHQAAFELSADKVSDIRAGDVVNVTVKLYTTGETFNAAIAFVEWDDDLFNGYEATTELGDPSVGQFIPIRNVDNGVESYLLTRLSSDTEDNFQIDGGSSNFATFKLRALQDIPDGTTVRLVSSPVVSVKFCQENGGKICSPYENGGVDQSLVTDTVISFTNNSDTCLTGETLCSDVCVDTSSDTDNCGECENVCNSDETCENGECIESNQDCLTGETLCSDVCVDTSSDTGNCGECGYVCDTGSCVNGSCVEYSLKYLKLYVHATGVFDDIYDNMSGFVATLKVNDGNTASESLAFDSDGYIKLPNGKLDEDSSNDFKLSDSYGLQVNAPYVSYNPYSYDETKDYILGSVTTDNRDIKVDFGEVCVGDLNEDGIVNDVDISILVNNDNSNGPVGIGRTASEYIQANGGIGYSPVEDYIKVGDFNRDGKINMSDWSLQNKCHILNTNN